MVVFFDKSSKMFWPMTLHKIKCFLLHSLNWIEVISPWIEKGCSNQIRLVRIRVPLLSLVSGFVAFGHCVTIRFVNRDSEFHSPVV